MDKKLGTIALVFIILLAAISFFNYNVNVSKGEQIAGGMAFAEYEYYVVGGNEMHPTLPPPDTSPSGFTFTCTAYAENGSGSFNLGTGGYNFDWLYEMGRPYLYDGNLDSGSTSNDNAYVVLDITNNLGYDITIEDLTAEVTGGTSWEPTFWFGAWFSNFTVLMVDTLDPWEERLPFDHIDQVEECNYYTGAVNVRRDVLYCDWTMGPNGAPRTPANVGPFTLLDDDRFGDALATGHVATRYNASATPITLANGATFREYFGLTVWGKIPVGTQFDATVELRLKYFSDQSVDEVADVYIPAFYAYWPTYNDSTDMGFPEWTNLILNASVYNYGNVPLNARVDVYYINGLVPFPYVPPPDAAWTYLFSQNVSIPVCNSTDAGWVFDFKGSGLGKGYWLFKANATATEQGGGLAATDDGFSCMFFARVLGDVDYDGDVDVGDQRKVQLAMFTSAGNPVYEEWNSYPTYTDMDGDGDVDVGDQRKQQLWMFKTQNDP